ncbi:hypothetical protein N803_05790 [Knoellia subterranea KCTC 19937]|uniref:Uncharacterized protein n=2 Tax=Knoellia TaxID=136099 RepID=A0A0A0JHU0_9MICO|nr:hypothetical protein N803_05790 [Knoellia subterranea KCTC 19937]
MFEAAVQESPPVIDALIDRYAGASGALQSFAEELESAQRRCQAAIERHAAATDEYLRLEGLLVAAQGTPDEALVLRRHNHAMSAVVSAERDHRAAWQSFTEADRRTAGRLRALAADVLDDPTSYAALATMQEFSGEMSSMPPVLGNAPGLKQLGAAGEVSGFISGVGLRAFYGEGSWKTVGINAVGTVGTGAGAVVKRGSVVGAHPVSRLDTRARDYAGEKLSTRQRFFIGTREQLHATFPKASQRLDPSMQPSRRIILDGSDLPTTPTAGLPLADKARVLAERAKVMARRKADAVLLDDWRAASAGGPTAQRMFVAGVTLEKATPQAESRLVKAVEAGEEKPDEGTQCSDLSLNPCQSEEGDQSETADPSTPRN